MSKVKIICFGEILWDIFPKKKIVGGAPLNVACHLQNLGIHTSLISQVGDDELGVKLLDFLSHRGITTKFIEISKDFPTGTVDVSFDDKGSPQYEIKAPAAWDYISMNDKKSAAIKDVDALVFGSLACRSERSKECLLTLAKTAAFRVFDVNLRSPFYTKETIETLLSLADLVKMSDEELGIIAAWYLTEFDEQSALQFFKERFELETIVLTKGKHGAICLNGNTIYSQTSFPIQLMDTVGSGDAFLAALLTKIFERKAIPSCLEFACAMGALVASQQGGTPLIKEQDITRFIRHQNSLPQEKSASDL